MDTYTRRRAFTVTITVAVILVVGALLPDTSQQAFAWLSGAAIPACGLGAILQQLPAPHVHLLAAIFLSVPYLTHPVFLSGMLLSMIACTVWAAFHINSGSPDSENPE